MRCVDNKKYRDRRIRKQKLFARDKKENILGVETGFADMNGEAICSGSVVLILPNKADSFPVTRIAVVFWDNFLKPPQYCAMRGCWYGERNYSDPRCYGKIEKYFNGKSGKYDTVKVVGQLTGDKNTDKLTLEHIFKRC